MKRFGVDAKVCQALIAIKAFDGDPIRNMKYYYAFREWNKMQNESRKKIEGLREKLSMFGFNKEITKENIQEWAISYKTDEKKDKRAINGILKTFKANSDRLDIDAPRIDNFNELDYQIEDEELLALLQDSNKADVEYLGFLWTSPLELALKEFSQYTFDYLENSERSCENVDAYIQEVNKKKSKNNKDYYSIKIEDILGNAKFVTIWDSDYKQFQEELKPGAIARIKVQKPAEGSKFRTYTLAPTPNRWKTPPKHLDHRIVLL
jgi:hypothetical protein